MHNCMSKLSTQLKLLQCEYVLAAKICPKYFQFCPKLPNFLKLDKIYLDKIGLPPFPPHIVR